MTHDAAEVRTTLNTARGFVASLAAGIGLAAGLLLWWGQPPTFSVRNVLLFAATALAFGSSLSFWIWFAVLGVTNAVVTRFRRRRKAQGLCPGCGYDLRGGHQRCPECGEGNGPLVPSDEL